MTAGTALLVNLGIAVSWLLIGLYVGRHLRDRRYGMVAPERDPHQHCDRHPIRCTWMRLGDSARENLKLMERYGETLRTVAECEKCAGCAMSARATLAPNYEED